MISYLSGKILNKGDNFLIIQVNHIGYKVMVHEELYAQLSTGQDTQLYIYQYVRENALDLYGLESFEKLNLFELLLSISGIGPKSALSAVYVSSVGEFQDSISRGDPSLLTKVSGIGKKTAERAVLDLREKIGNLNTASDFGRDSCDPSSGKGRNDEVEALIGLGYSKQQATEALRQVSTEIVDSGERIREALKKIGRRN